MPQNKDRSLTIRLTQKQYHEAERLANERDTRIGEFFRFLLDTYLSTH